MQADELLSILDLISYKPGYTFKVASEKHGLFFRLEVSRHDSVTGIMGLGYMPWLNVESYTNKDQIVRQALKMILSFEEHEVREQFKYKGQAIFGPHLCVEALAFASLQESKLIEHPTGKSGAW